MELIAFWFLLFVVSVKNHIFDSYLFCNVKPLTPKDSPKRTLSKHSLHSVVFISFNLEIG